MLSLVFVVSLVVLLHAKGDMFGGKWVLDKASPRPADAPNNLQISISQDSSSVTFQNVFKEPENGVVPLLYLGVMTTKLRLGTDGQEEQNTIGPFQMASKTMVDGREMRTDWSATVQGDQVQGHWTHRLSDDGKQMTWDIKQNSPQGRHAEATLHFVRK
jgi:hypothetical protein